MTKKTWTRVIWFTIGSFVGFVVGCLSLASIQTYFWSVPSCSDWTPKEEGLKVYRRVEVQFYKGGRWDTVVRLLDDSVTHNHLIPKINRPLRLVVERLDGFFEVTVLNDNSYVSTK